MTSLVDLYAFYCKRAKCHPNSSFATALHQRSLEDFDFSVNYIGPKGLDPVLEVVRNNSQLKSLNLNSNWLEQASVAKVVETAVHHPNIRSLSLSDNPIHSSSFRALLYLLTQNGNIVDLEVERTDLTAAERTKLKDALMRNRKTPHDSLLNRKNRISAYSTPEEEEGDPRVATYSGTWGAGTSGGCLHYNTWRDNQQLSLWPSRSGSVSISLKQTSPEEPRHTIGIVVVKRNDINSHQSILTYQPTDLLAESNFEEGRSHLTVALDQKVQGVDDPYTIIPVTFRPGRQGSYTLTVKEVRPDEQPGSTDTQSTTFVLEAIKPERDWRRLEPLACEWHPQTAGGCRDYPSWRANRQYQITAQTATKVFIVLSKAVDRDQNDEREIGFYILKGPSEPGRKEIMMHGSNVIASTMFSRTTSVSLMVDIPKGGPGIILLPTTIRPNQCGEFWLHMYSEAEIAVDPLPQEGYWDEHTATGLWDISTNGGCRQVNSASWVYNPSYELEMKEMADVLVVLEKVPSALSGDRDRDKVEAMQPTRPLSSDRGTPRSTNPRKSWAVRTGGSTVQGAGGRLAPADSRHPSTIGGRSRAGSGGNLRAGRTPQPPGSVAGSAAAARPADEADDPPAPPKVFSEEAAHEGAISLLLIDNNASGTAVSQCLRQENTTTECALWCPYLPASASGYLVIPSFIEAGLEGKYVLRIYSSRKLVMDQGMTMKARIKLRERLKWKAENDASNRERRLDAPDSKFQGDPAMRPCMEERDRIVSNYLTRGVQHLDKEFPPSSTSIYLDPDADPCPVLSAWKRPQDTCLDAGLFKGGKRSGCLRAGLVKDLWFLGAAAMVATQPKLLQHVFLSVYPEYGFYQLRFFIYGEWVPVTVDDLLAVDAENALLFAASPVANELWPAVLEKAYAKLHGTYEALEIDGDVADALADLTGGVAEKVALPLAKDRPLAPTPDCPYEVALSGVYTKLSSALRDNYPVGFILSKSETNSVHLAEKRALGVHPDHVYPVLQVREVKGTRLVCLRDCWGHGRWTGKFSAGSNAWTPDLREAVAFDPEADDGSFWMAWDEVTYYFTSVYVCRLHGSYNVQPDHWTIASVHGEWAKGSTDGGGATTGDDWVRNVQYALDFADYTGQGEGAQGGAGGGAPDSFPVWVQVEQRDARLDVLKTVSADRKRLEYTNPIGMHLFSSDSNSRKLVALTSREGVRTARCQQRRMVSAEWKVVPGSKCYTVVPCTQTQGQTGEFLLTVAAPRPVAIRAIQSNFNISIDGTWKGASRGGAPKLFGTWRDNPFYLLTCAETTTLTLILRQSNPLNSTTARIGLLVYDAKGPRRFLQVEDARIVATAEHSNTDKVAVKVHVVGVRERGGLPYLIVPSTYYPRQDSDFTIEVVGNKKSTIRRVDPFIDYSCYAVQGCWSEVAGTTGGSVEFPSWRASPQYLLHFDDRTGGEKKFLIALTKLLPNTVTTDSLEICLTVFRATDIEGGWRTRVAQPADDDIVASTGYTERGSTNYIELEASLPYNKHGYIVMASTRYPYAEGDFKLSIYTDTDAKLLEPPADKLWNTVRFDGAWRPGVCAGGSREAYRTWGCNPNYRLVVKEHCNVVLVLTQRALLPGQGGKRGSDARQETAAARRKKNWQQNLIDKSNNASIGIDLCRDDDDLTHIRRIQYDYATVVSMTLPNVGPGSYVVVPHTFEAEIESEYNLVIYADAGVAAEKIEKKRRYY